MAEAKKWSKLGQPVPELPVADVVRAQQYYRDVLGFEIAWLEPDETIGAVTRVGEVAVFLRRRERSAELMVHWMFAPDIDACYAEMQTAGADIIEPLQTKPWGLRQFTIKDIDGNIFRIHHD